METIFWISCGIIFYTYLGYPLCLAVLKRIGLRQVKKGNYQPCVSVVLAACNEEHNIVKRIQNLMEQDYPPEKVQIIVVSDGSEDRTVELASCGYGSHVEVVALNQRVGKAAALNAGMERATGDVVVFCDARQTFDPGVIRELASNFSDEGVGCVSGELMLLRATGEGVQTEMGAYWRYEKWVRQAESASGSVMGATGAIYTIRRHLYRPLPQGTLLDDVMIPMQVVMQGYRVVFDGSAKAYDIVSQNVSQEWERKVRTLAGNWQILSLLPDLLLPWRNPFCLRYFSHKVLRLLAPAVMLMLVTSGALLPGTFYAVATWLQVVFYALAVMGAIIPTARANRVVNFSYFFAVMNLAALAGFYTSIRGQTCSIWKVGSTAPNR